MGAVVLVKQDGGCGKMSCLRARRRPGWGRPVGGPPSPWKIGGVPQELLLSSSHPTVASPTPQASQKPGTTWNGRSQNGRRGHKAPSLPGRLGRGRALRPDHGHSSQPRGAVWGGRRGGGTRGGWGAGEEPERGAGRGTKGPFVERSREKRERITQCPEAMLVTREPFSASLGKQLGAERDRERFNPMGAGRRGLRPLWEVGRERGHARGPFRPSAGRFPVSQAWSVDPRSRGPIWLLGQVPAAFGPGDWSHGSWAWSDQWTHACSNSRAWPTPASGRTPLNPYILRLQVLGLVGPGSRATSLHLPPSADREHISSRRSPFLVAQCCLLENFS